MSRLFDALESRFAQWLGPTLGAVVLFVVEVVWIVLIAVAIIWPVRTYVVAPFIVRGASMEPNFYDSEYLLVDELSYLFGDPKRGDIVVFHYPEDEREYFIKRVIGLPGDTVGAHAGHVTVSSADHVAVELDETYIPYGATDDFEMVTLGEGEYFLMGDNRDGSHDSRAFGPVAKRYIVGKVLVRGFPIQRFTLFSRPEYNI